MKLKQLEVGDIDISDDESDDLQRHIADREVASFDVAEYENDAKPTSKIQFLAFSWQHFFQKLCRLRPFHSEGCCSWPVGHSGRAFQHTSWSFDLVSTSSC